MSKAHRRHVLLPNPASKPTTSSSTGQSQKAPSRNMTMRMVMKERGGGDSITKKLNIFLGLALVPFLKTLDSTSWKCICKWFNTSYAFSRASLSSHVRYVGVIWFLFLVGHLYLIGVWMGDDQRANVIKTCVYFYVLKKRTASSSFTDYSILNTEHN